MYCLLLNVIPIYLVFFFSLHLSKPWWIWYSFKFMFFNWFFNVSLYMNIVSYAFDLFFCLTFVNVSSSLNSILYPTSINVFSTSNSILSPISINACFVSNSIFYPIFVYVSCPAHCQLTTTCDFMVIGFDHYKNSKFFKFCTLIEIFFLTK